MTDDEKKYTERDLILAKREVWEDTWRLAWAASGRSLTRPETAVMRYPFPKKTRPRVVTVEDTEWRVFGGHLQVRYGAHGGWYGPVPRVTQARVAVWTDLFAHPTEEVEDDG
jgi:hypothetical protein